MLSCHAHMQDADRQTAWIRGGKRDMHRLHTFKEPLISDLWLVAGPTAA